MVRMNKGTPVRVTGGDLTQAAGNLYLLSAEQEDVYIEFRINIMTAVSKGLLLLVT